MPWRGAAFGRGRRDLGQGLIFSRVMRFPSLGAGRRPEAIAVKGKHLPCVGID